MTRTRRQEDPADSQFYLGTNYMDTSYPYGDGPWLYPSVVNAGWDPGFPYHFQKVCWDELHPGPPYRSGGPLDIRKAYSDQYTVKGNVDHIYHMWRYAGGFRPFSYPSTFMDWKDPDSMPDAWGDAGVHGATAWNKFRPTKPSVDLGVFLGEIKEVPRMMKTTAKGFADLWRTMGGSPTGFGPKGVANHWLNTQFGWFPFLNDLQDFYETCAKLDKRIKQLRRDNGRWVRRRGVVYEENQTEVLADETHFVGLLPALNTYHYDSLHENGNGTWQVVQTRLDRVWFSAAYRYWIPGNDESFLWKGKALAMLYGLQPSPALIYNLTPWSWLLDWCSNMGDVISNISDISINSLCAKYAYIMRHMQQRVDCIGSVNLKYANPQASWSAVIDRKHRVGASPFGFGLDESEFDARQWSILTALGITRLK